MNETELPLQHDPNDPDDGRPLALPAAATLTPSQLLLACLGVLGGAWLLGWGWLGAIACALLLLLSLQRVAPDARLWLARLLVPAARERVLAWVALAVSVVAGLHYLGVYRAVSAWLERVRWDEFGSWADWVGALGQVAIAVLAVYVAWRQYVISRDLTIQQNRITQQQTIDAYFQGVSDLALSEEGLLEDWPQERAFAEGRTAAILNSVDAQGKAKIVRFLSQSRLLSPLQRDGHLGRPILDGRGGYAEDRDRGVRVIDLGVMLAGADLAGADLRWVDLSEANLVRANLTGADCYRANLSRAVLYEASLAGANLRSARLFYGSIEVATPRSRSLPPRHSTGDHTGAVVENTDFTGVEGMSEEQRVYCCAWCGERSRATIPGGCDGIPNRLGR